MSSSLKVLLLPATLRGGGTERQVVNLAIALHGRGHEVAVAVPYAGEQYQPVLEAAGIEVVPTLKGSEPAGRYDPRRLVNMALRVSKTFRLIQLRQFDVVYSFGLFINVYTAFVCLRSRSKLVWGIRDSRPGPPKGFWLAERILVRRAALAIANSQAGRQSWICRNLPSSRIIVIPNGIDTQRFVISDEWRDQVRTELGIDSDTRLVGIVGRTNPVKNHELFLQAARIAVERQSNIRFVIIGQSTGERDARLRTLATELEIDSRVIWTGPTDQAERYFNALDVSVSCSTTEGFANVIVESMACGTPCVATDVGDARVILEGYGQVVEDPEPECLANAILEELGKTGPERRSRIRDSVVERFSLGAMVDQTESALQKVRDTERKRA